MGVDTGGAEVVDVVVVVVEHAGAGGGQVAAPMAQKVLARYFEKNPASTALGVEMGAPHASSGSD